jgi:hypothetical protein
MAAVKSDVNRCLVGFNTVEKMTSSSGTITYSGRFRVIRYLLMDGDVKWQKVSAFDAFYGEIIGLQFGH